MNLEKKLFSLFLMGILNLSGLQNSLGQEQNPENVQGKKGVVKEFLGKQTLKDENFYNEVIKNKKDSSGNTKNQIIGNVSDVLTFYRKPKNIAQEYSKRNFYKEVFNQWKEKIKQDPFYIERNGWDNKSLPFESKLYEAFYDVSVNKMSWIRDLDKFWQSLDKKTTIKIEQKNPINQDEKTTMKIKPRVKTEGNQISPYVRFKGEKLRFFGDIESRIARESIVIGKEFNLNSDFLKQSLKRELYFEMEFDWKKKEINFMGILEAYYW